MSSPAQAAAARRNSLRSTGPKSVQGKLTSSKNATRHGLFSKQPMLPDENPVEFELLAQRLMEAFAPDGMAEELLVGDILGAIWRLRRLQRVETALYAVGSSGPVTEALRQAGEAANGIGAAFAAQSATFGILTRYETSLVNRLRRDLADLDRLQSARESDAADIVLIPRSL